MATMTSEETGKTIRTCFSSVIAFAFLAAMVFLIVSLADLACEGLRDEDQGAVMTRCLASEHGTPQSCGELLKMMKGEENQ
jgi:hypothetical protein